LLLIDLDELSIEESSGESIQSDENGLSVMSGMSSLVGASYVVWRADGGQVLLGVWLLVVSLELCGLDGSGLLDFGGE